MKTSSATHQVQCYGRYCEPQSRCFSARCCAVVTGYPRYQSFTDDDAVVLFGSTKRYRCYSASCGGNPNTGPSTYHV